MSYLVSVRDYEAGYLAALKDMSGCEGLLRWKIINADKETAAMRSLVDTGWLEREIDQYNDNTPEKLCAKQPKVGTIYVAADTYGRLKIGYTQGTPAPRVQQIGNASGLTMVLVGCTPGTRADEEGFHLRFREHRLCGEWFRSCREIMDWAESL